MREEVSQWVSQLVLHSGLELTTENELVLWLVIPSGCLSGCLPEYSWVSVLEFLTELVSMSVNELGSLLVCGLEYASVYASESPSA